MQGSEISEASAADLPQLLPQSTAAKDQQEHKKPVLGLNAILELVRASATEISGSELDENAHFANHHFDSLSAVELANSIGKAVGLSLPSKASLFTISLEHYF